VSYQFSKIPEGGERIQVQDGILKVPDNPYLAFIEGDGIGPDIMKAAMTVFNAAVEKAYGNRKKPVWVETYAGEKAQKLTGEWIPRETFDLLRDLVVGIKGPLTTPIGGGIRSLNVTLRQTLDLYACIRPVRWIPGVPSPVTHPEKVNVVIFRENTEDVYSGIEWASGSRKALRIIEYLNHEMGTNIDMESGIGVKPMSPKATKKLVRLAAKYALDHNRDSLTLVHKGNIMKFTEGAFRDWGYEEVTSTFRDQVVTESELWDEHNGKRPEGKLLVKDRIADAMFQQVLLRPSEYDIVALPNLNGDYISDALAAQVGGLGLAPGANIGDQVSLFEATHGTAPKYAGQDKVNPGSLILSGEMMFRHLGWNEAADLIVSGIEKAVAAKRVTYDLERQMEGATLLKCSEFGDEIVRQMG